jgi:hypothetical protein
MAKPDEIPGCLSIARWIAKRLYDRVMGHYTSLLMTLAFYDAAAGIPGMSR